MSSIADRVFSEVCLDERVSDGIFRMEEEAHMDALRDYFIKKGITKEAVVSVTNRMVEGKYPDRQAYRKEDGILVTWPSPKHKQKAMKENPGKYVEQNPIPNRPSEEPQAKEPVASNTPPPKEEPTEEEPESKPQERPGSNLFGTDNGVGMDGKIQQGDKQLSVEPVRGTGSPPPAPTSPTPPPAPRTPERVAAEKEVIKQIMSTDDTTLSNIATPLHEELRQQIIKELYTKADKLGLREVVTFLTPYVKP